VRLQALEIDNCIIFGVKLVFVLSLSGPPAPRDMRQEKVRMLKTPDGARVAVIPTLAKKITSELAEVIKG
jgi:hypothetical protein